MAVDVDVRSSTPRVYPNVNVNNDYNNHQVQITDKNETNSPSKLTSTVDIEQSEEELLISRESIEQDEEKDDDYLHNHQTLQVPKVKKNYYKERHKNNLLTRLLYDSAKSIISSTDKQTTTTTTTLPDNKSNNSNILFNKSWLLDKYNMNSKTIQQSNNYNYSDLNENNFLSGNGYSNRDYSNNNNNKKKSFYDSFRINNFSRLKLSFLFIIFLVSFLFIFTKLTSFIYEQQNAIDRNYKTLLSNSRKQFDYYVNGHVNDSIISSTSASEKNNKNKNWLIESPKCHIPQINPWHESIKSYVSISKPMNCSKYLNETNNVELSYVEDNKLYFTKEALANQVLDGNCCIRQIRRSDENDDDLIYDKACLPIKENGIEIPFELIKIECFNNYTSRSYWKDHKEDSTIDLESTSTFNNETLKESKLKSKRNVIKAKKKIKNKKHKSYSNIHAFIVPKPTEWEILNRALLENLLPDQYYNVLMIGMDTISRLNAYRQLNETMSLLREKYSTIEFKGYNKVGENTFPNLIPLLTGLMPSQLVETKCWLATNYTDDNERGDEYLNDCKYLWNFYQEFGYMTYFSEDWPQASTFNYLKPGFKQEPTAYYGRPITLARQSFLTGSSHHMDCDICVLSKPIVQLDLNHLKSYIKFYKNKPHFAFQWINCPQHDNLNGASSVDHIVKDFFKSILDMTHNDRTFVIFFSDHGWRWNDFVGTRIGHYESSLPLLTIAPPKHFIENHQNLYKKLKSYERTLITPFDLFKTLIDIRNLGKKDPSSAMFTTDSSSFYNNADYINQQQATGNDQKQSTFESTTSSSDSNDAFFKQIPTLNGINYKQNFKTFSLLDENVQGNNFTQRSCIEAGIPDNYCVCNEFKHVDTNSYDVLAAAYYLVYVHLDTRVLDGEKICVRLELKEVNKAERYDFDEKKKTITKERRRRRDTITNNNETSIRSDINKNQLLHLKTTPSPSRASTTEEIIIDETHYLPNREYNLEVVTLPGNGIFQEVLRYYGDNIDDCNEAYQLAKQIIDSSSNKSDYNSKREAVIEMNKKCKFSVHSDSISRLNLYRDQSKCVKSNIELKKVCYCKDLLEKQ